MNESTRKLRLNAMLSDPLRPEGRQLSSAIAGAIRAAILTGQLTGGEQLFIDELAEEFEASTTPVREALNILSGEGFVAHQKMRGFRVIPLTTSEIKDLFLVHSFVAGELAARAATRLDATELEALRKLNKKIMATAANASSQDTAFIAEIESLNFEFHRIIYQAANSAKISWVLGILLRYVPFHFQEQIPGWVEASVHDHGPILDALEERDAESVRKAMQEHIEHGGAILVEHLERVNFGVKQA